MTSAIMGLISSLAYCAYLVLSVLESRNIDWFDLLMLAVIAALWSINARVAEKEGS